MKIVAQKFRSVIDAIEFYRRRAAAYRTVFRSERSSDVVADLAKFCCAFESCAVMGNEQQTWLNLGKNLVWLRIQQHLNLSPQELAQLYEAVAYTQE